MKAEIIRWVDGDTLKANVFIRDVLVFIKVDIRIKGLDCPELQGYNIERALKALEFANKRWPPGATLNIQGEINIDRYGRFVARLHDGNADVADTMIKEGLCRPSSY